jgi:hypothetical protein
LAKIAENCDHNIDPWTDSFESGPQSAEIPVSKRRLKEGSPRNFETLVPRLPRGHLNIRVEAGLPDGLFQNQKSQFGKFFYGLGIENVGLFFALLEYSMAMWYILW